MARKPRIHYPGALYHVMVRGNNGEMILREGTEKNKYLDILAKYKEKLYFKLFAFCIMDNHAHLLIQVDNVPLSQIMQRVQQVYTQWYNSKHGRTGHVFQQRYKALLCDKDNYLFQLLHYIHNNPVKANLDKGIEYQWSSHLYYLGKGNSQLVDTEEILGLISPNRKEAIKQYIELMIHEQGEISYENLDGVQIQNRTRINTEQHKKKSIDEIIKTVCCNEKVSINEVTKRTKLQKIVDIRKAIVLLSERYCDTSNIELAVKLNLSPSMISKIKSGESKGTTYMEEVIKRWEGISK